MRALPSLGFVEAIKLASSRILDFNSRSRRSEFWWWFLFAIIIGLLSLIPVIGWLLAIIMFLPNLSIQIRRLHDTGRSGWYWLLAFIPLIGFICLLVFYLQDSKPGENEYGPNPKGIGNAEAPAAE